MCFKALESESKAAPWFGPFFHGSPAITASGLLHTDANSSHSGETQGSAIGDGRFSPTADVILKMHVARQENSITEYYPTFPC